MNDNEEMEQLMKMVEDYEEFINSSSDELSPEDLDLVTAARIEPNYQNFLNLLNKKINNYKCIEVLYEKEKKNGRT